MLILHLKQSFRLERFQVESDLTFWCFVTVLVDSVTCELHDLILKAFK